MDQKDRKRTEQIYKIFSKCEKFSLYCFEVLYALVHITFFNPPRVQEKVIILIFYMDKLSMENYIFTYYICASIDKNRGYHKILR